jgi:heme/copper-type cytochrome/quinol oxidase subunit 1
MATQAAFMPGAQEREVGVLWSWLTTVDHKRIGILYGSTAFIFFLIGGIEALIMRVQLARPDRRSTSCSRCTARR